jgi:hypothetical protein
VACAHWLPVTLCFHDLKELGYKDIERGSLQAVDFIELVMVEFAMFLWLISPVVIND